MPLSPNALAANAEAVERLCWSFDFRLETDLDQIVWFTVDGAKAFRPIGRDGAGGVFALPPSQYVLYVSSEGQAGIVAADFDEFIQLIVPLLAGPAQIFRRRQPRRDAARRDRAT
jgi:hypothetical protein